MNIKSKFNDSLDKCSECGGEIIHIQERGEMVCNQCGLVAAQRTIDISHGGKRAFTTEEKSKKERLGSPQTELIPNKALNTVIDKKRIKNSDLKRAAEWDSRLPWCEKNLLLATNELKRIASNLSIPEVIKVSAIRYYKKAFEKNLLRGRTIDGMIAACLYYACREVEHPKTFHELVEESKKDAKHVRRCLKVLIQELKLKPLNANPLNMIPKYCADLGLDIEVESAAIRILRAYVDKYSTSGKDPKGLCAGAIYLVAKVKGRRISQRAVAEKVGVTEVTLRSRQNDLIRGLNIHIPK